MMKGGSNVPPLWAKLNRANQAISDLPQWIPGFDCTLNIPRVGVLGDQSSGKSSMLEFIVGVSGFLPRGTGMVTKVPILLKLQNDPNAPAGSTSFTFDGPDGERLINNDPPAVEKEIRRRTDLRLQKSKKSVASEPVSITIKSRTVPNITLIDLPGLIKFSRQDKELPAEVESLARAFVSRKDTVILMVTENKDIANSYGLKVADEVDPSHSRTIGVITKIDVESPGDISAFDILRGKENNQVPKLRLGWYGLRNPTQAELEDRSFTMEHAREKSQSFLQNHKHYKSVLKQCGHDNLILRVQEHIFNGAYGPKLQDCLHRITDQERETEKQLEDLTDGLSSGSSVHDLMLKFSKDVEKALDGNAGAVLLDAATIELRDTLMAINLDDQPFLRDDAVNNTIYDVQGFSGRLQVAEAAARKLFPDAAKLFFAPLALCVDKCKAVFSTLVDGAADSSLADKPKFKEFALKGVSQRLTEDSKNLHKGVKEMIDREVKYLNSRAGDGEFAKLLEGSHNGPIESPLRRNNNSDGGANFENSNNDENTKEDENKEDENVAHQSPAAPSPLSNRAKRRLQQQKRDQLAQQARQQQQLQNDDDHQQYDQNTTHQNNKESSIIQTVQSFVHQNFDRVRAKIIEDYVKFLNDALVHDAQGKTNKIILRQIDEYVRANNDINLLLKSTDEVDNLIQTLQNQLVKLNAAKESILNAQRAEQTGK